MPAPMLILGGSGGVGSVKTPLAVPLTTSETMAKSIAALHPLARLGEADDVAAAAAFLLGPDSGWMGPGAARGWGRSSVRTKGLSCRQARPQQDPSGERALI